MKMGRGTLRLILGMLLAASLALAAGVQQAAATVLVVDDNHIECPTAPYTTIQDAVNAASPGDTIEVCAGLYPEPAAGPLTINKRLTLEGANQGADARGPRGPESVIADLQGTFITASNVVIDGFTVKNSIVAAFTGYGILMGVGTTGTEILNNIIEDNIVGIGLANTGASQAVIQHNLIRNNNRPGGASGSGIYTDEFVGGPTVRNVLIDENDFIGHAGFGAAINISNTDFAHGVFDLTVTDNRFVSNNRAFVLFNTHSSLFDDNTITNSTLATSADVRVLDNNSDLLFTNNNLRGGTGHAIRFTAFIGFPSEDVEFHFNNIEIYALTGLTVDPLSHVGTVNAECNWWNSPSGPTAASNLGGTGEEVVGDADFTPWLIAPAPGGPCLGGLPSTPGKVSGGGQTEGDPLFSPFGELLTLPALVPSLFSPAAQATFGFIAKCCPESGNLEYNDHQADVRIKAEFFDGLFISSPGTSCPATPGSKHATITGMAKVIRATGTASERIIVEVDDCGEPGTADSFGIEAETYSNPPSTLVGGNIQIR